MIRIILFTFTYPWYLTFSAIGVNFFLQSIVFDYIESIHQSGKCWSKFSQKFFGKSNLHEKDEPALNKENKQMFLVNLRKDNIDRMFAFVGCAN